MTEDIFRFPGPRELLEIIFQVLFTHSAGDAGAADIIWEEYKQYRMRWSEEHDPEDSFIVGVIMLALDDFTSARTALWDAVKDLNMQHEISKIRAASPHDESTPNDGAEYTKSLIKYFKYLVMAYLTPLRTDPDAAQREIEIKDLNELTALLEKTSLPDYFSKFRNLLLAQAYESASRRACVSRAHIGQPRKEQVEQYFKKAREHYKDYGEFPEEFQAWTTHLQRSEFCR